MEITSAVAVRVLSVVDAGLSEGLGDPKPGFMCVEAAVSYALGLPHGDNLSCVTPVLRSLKIALNDKQWSSKAARAKGLRRLALAQLGSAGALDEKEFVRRVAEGTIRKQVPFALRIAASLHKEPKHQAALTTAASRCEKEGTGAAAYAASDAAYVASNAAFVIVGAGNAVNAARAAGNASNAAAYAANAVNATADASNAAAYAGNAAADAAYAAAEAAKKKDEVLSTFAEDVVKLLIAMNAPGCQWLTLTEA